MRKKRKILAFLIVCVFQFSESSYAGNWTITPGLQENFEVDSNPLLRAQGVKTLFGFTSQPELNFSDQTPSESLFFDTRLDVSRFNLPNFSSSDVHSNFGGRETADSGFLQLNGNFDYDTTRTSEILASGLNVAGIRHTGLNISPEVGFQLFQLDLLTVQGTFQKTTYDTQSDVFNDYEVFQLNPTLTHTIDANNAALATIQASYFKTTSGPSGNTKSIGPGVGWQHKFSLPVSLDATGGYDFTTFNQFGIHSTKQDYFFNINLSYTGLSDTLSLTLARQLSPEATTLQITTTSIALQEEHDFTPRTTGVINFNYEDDSVSIFAPGQQLKFLEAFATLKYKLTETFAMSVGYRFRQEKRIGESTTDDSNAVLVNFILSPSKFLFSR